MTTNVQPRCSVPTPAEVAYAHHDGEALCVDVYAQEPGTAAPTVLYIHGGGWCGGDKRDDGPLFDALARAGVVCVSPNYRLAPDHQWPACLDDARAALAWTFAHAAEHGGNPERITLIGYSAGGHLALQLAVTEHDPRIVGMVGLAAPTDWVLDNFRRLGLSECMQKLFGQDRVDEPVLDRLWDASPINHLHPGVPRCLQVHGDRDQAVPLSQGRHFHARLRRLGVDSTLIVLPGAPHNIRQWPDARPDVFTELTRWVTDPAPVSAVPANP